MLPPAPRVTLLAYSYVATLLMVIVVVVLLASVLILLRDSESTL